MAVGAVLVVTWAKVFSLPPIRYGNATYNGPLLDQVIQKSSLGST
jgi:hypothetical protein